MSGSDLAGQFAATDCNRAVWSRSLHNSAGRRRLVGGAGILVRPEDHEAARASSTTGAIESAAEPMLRKPGRLSKSLLAEEE